MEGGRVYGGGSDFMALLDNSNNSLWVPSTSHFFHETMVNFNPDAQQGHIPSPSPSPSPNPNLLSRVSDGEGTGGEESEPNPFHRPDKKRRLAPEQVQFLEKSFKVENKLEPERKVQLAKELGLQPRQVAIWFQNRRARFKTKQLEKDYDSLKASYDRLKEDFDTLVKERDDLQNEVKLLTKKLKKRDPRQANLDPSSPDRSEGLLDPRPEKKPKVEHEKGPELGVEAKTKLHVEDASSAKSDVYDSESPHCTEGNPFTQTGGPVDSTRLPDPDQQSDSSLDEEDEHLISMGKSILFPPTPPALFNNKFDENECYDLNGSNSCSFSLVDDQPVWSLLY